MNKPGAKKTDAAYKKAEKDKADAAKDTAKLKKANDDQKKEEQKKLAEQVFDDVLDKQTTEFNAYTAW